LHNRYVNEEITRSIDFKAYDDHGELRNMSPNEILVGQYGKIVNLGDSIVNLGEGSLVLLGRSVVGSIENNMLLDNFAKDEHGRLMHP